MQAHAARQHLPDTTYGLTCFEALDQLSSVTPSPSTVSTSTAASSHSTSPTAMNENVTPSPPPPPEPRRSQRDRTSTVIEIDGHTVLKSNNYVLKGLGYQFGDNSIAQQGKVKAKRKPTAAPGPSAKTQRVLAPSETRRLHHNASIRQRVQNKSQTRLEHFARHKSVLAPFLDQATQYRLNSVPVPTETAAESPDLFVQPRAIQAEMRDYQMAGLNWMVKMHHKNQGMILGDEMGLGKTLQTISLLCYLKEREGVTGPSLVICPLSVLYSWCNEIKKWAPSLKFLRFHSSCAQEREHQRAEFAADSCSYDVVVTTYEMAKQPLLKHLWSRQYFNYLVLDEGHKIKDAGSQISLAVRGIHRENSLILTGTPLQNNLVELWSLLNFLSPDIFASSEPFAQAFDIVLNVVNKNTLQDAQKLLGLFMLRRLKHTVEKLMPKKLETKVLCPLSATQVFWYKALLMKDISLLANMTGDASVSVTNKGKHLSNLIMQLRKCCLHPFLFSGAETDPNETSLEDLVAASGKLAVLDKLLMSLYKKGHRTVLFSQFTSVLDILEDYCNMRGWNFCRFDGSTARAKRNYIVNSFNAPNSDKFIFLMSTRSGGMGLNLQTADTCILYDSDWNPQPDLQAMARVHRIGQKKKVHVYRLVTHGTIEERMVERAQKKLYMDRMVNTAGGAGVDPSKNEVDQVSESDLMSTIRFGCNAVFGQDAEKRNSLPTDADIEVITDRSRSEDFSGGNLKGGAANKTDDFEADKELTSTTKLAGVDFKALREDYGRRNRDRPSNVSGISEMWKQMQSKRNRKSRIVMLDSNSSGYGRASVPVLAANNYDLSKGESSVFTRELQVSNREDYGLRKRKVKKAGVDFENQSHCQVCGDGGSLICCPRCPVSVHLDYRCSGVHTANSFLSCSHHRCSKCGKNNASAGGLLFPCDMCPNAYCEDCIPNEARFLGDSERFLELGFSNKHTVYIHCSKYCEQIAKTEYGWKEPTQQEKMPCPPPMDISCSFGATVEQALEANPLACSTAS
mmetsp:Transcript_17445/g.25803  ORF Transcript_17445/g.25803 Transcript_17445/m.25803 type:complete len:1021 (-) Transcript_17445:135-3197(-)